MKQKIIILNGPPGIGKDTLAEELTKHPLGIAQKEFKQHLREQVKEGWNLGVDGPWFDYVANHRDLKDRVSTGLTLNEDTLYLIENRPSLPIPVEKVLVAGEVLYCTSPRGAMVLEAEIDTKPRYGEDFYGIMVGLSIKRGQIYGRPHYVFSDGGFPKELVGLSNVLGTDNFEYYVVRLKEDGFDFNSDSRDYLQEEDLPPYFNIVDVVLERGSITEGVSQIREKIGLLTEKQKRSLQMNDWNLVDTTEGCPLK